MLFLWVGVKLEYKVYVNGIIILQQIRKFEIITRDWLIIVLIEKEQIDCSPVVARWVEQLL